MVSGLLLGDVISLKRKIRQGMHHGECCKERQRSLLDEIDHGLRAVQKF